MTFARHSQESISWEWNWNSEPDSEPEIEPEIELEIEIEIEIEIEVLRGGRYLPNHNLQTHYL